MIFTPEQDTILQTIATGPSALVVEAGPGCAKTFTTLASMLLVSTDYPGQFYESQTRIAYVAFNKDVVEDVKKKLKDPEYGAINGGTFKARALTANALGLSVWSSHIGRNTRVVMDAGKSRRLLRELQDQGRYSIAPEEVDDILTLVTTAKSQGFLPPASGAVCRSLATFRDICEIADVRPEPHYEALICALLTLSIRACFKGDLDFDDQIYASALFATMGNEYDWIFVDEAQDLSPIQLYLLKRCKAKHIVLVGDPLQAIYAFRGAMSDAFDRIKATWPDAIHLPLQTSFRLPASVCKLLQEHNPALKTAKPELGTICNISVPVDMRSLQDWARPINTLQRPWSQAILCRNNAPLYRVALACIASKVRFQMTSDVFGKGLIRDIKRAVDSPANCPSGDLHAIMLDYWETDDMTKGQRAAMMDKLDTLEFLSQRCATAAGVCLEIASLSKKVNPSDSASYILLSTAHKAKGLEFDWVLHLDPHLIPAFFATTPEELAQEANVAYVINSRTKHTLLFARSDQIIIPGAARRTPRPFTKQDESL